MGSIYRSKVLEVKAFGVMIELFPGGPTAMVHLSQLDHKRVDHPSQLGIEIGQSLNVKYLGKDPLTNRHFVSRKSLFAPTSLQPQGQAIVKKLKESSDEIS